MSHVIDVNEENFAVEILESSVPVMLDFWAKWCGPCRVMDEDLEFLAAKYNGQVKLARLDVDANRSLALRYRITCLPTLMVFSQRCMEERLTGCMPRQTLENILKRNMLELAVV